MKETGNSIRLSITGYGMVSSLGHDAATSCSAARAGIIKSSELLNICFSEPETGELTPVVANTVFGCTEGFSGLGRITQLGVAAMNDLLSNFKVDDWSRTGLILIFEDGFHLIEAVKISETGQEAEVNIVSEINRLKIILSEQVPSKISELVGGDINPQFCKVIFGNEVSIIDALKKATDSLQKENYEQIIIGAIHSGVGVEMIEALDSLGLLKTPVQSVGLIPSEIAVFMTVENESVAMKMDRHLGVTINAIESFDETYDSFMKSPALGRALSVSINKTLCYSHDNDCNFGLVIGNLNGHSYRAQDWGAAVVSLKLDYPWLEELPEWYPSSNFGNTSVCSGFVAICLAIKGFERNYSGTSDILAWLCSDGSARGSFHIGYRALCK